MIEIRIKCYGKTYKLELSDESTIEDLARELKKIAYCIGYGGDSVESIFEGDVI